MPATCQLELVSCRVYVVKCKKLYDNFHGILIALVLTVNYENNKRRVLTRTRELIVILKIEKGRYIIRLSKHF